MSLKHDPSLEVITLCIGEEQIIPNIKSSGPLVIDFNKSTINWLAQALGIMTIGKYQFPAYAANDLCRIVSTIHDCNGTYEDEDQSLVLKIKDGLSEINKIIFDSHGTTWEKFIGALFSVMEDLRMVRDIITEFGEFSNYNTIPTFDQYAALVSLIGAIFNDILSIENDSDNVSDESYVRLYTRSLFKIDGLQDSVTTLLIEIAQKDKRIKQLENLLRERGVQDDEQL